MWTLNPPNYSLLYCIVLSYRVKILGQLSWHSNLYPLYKTKQRTDFLFKSGPNIGMKRHKNIFTFAPIIFNLFLSLSLSPGCLTGLTFQLLISFSKAIPNEPLRTEKTFSIQMELKHCKEERKMLFCFSSCIDYFCVELHNSTIINHFCVASESHYQNNDI